MPWCLHSCTGRSLRMHSRHAFQGAGCVLCCCTMATAMCCALITATVLDDYGASLLFATSADAVMVNSSWTASHVRQVWWIWDEPALVYPPCDTTDLQSLPLDRRLKHLFLVSVAQFRPEKNHRLQLEAYAMAREEAGAQARLCLLVPVLLLKPAIVLTDDLRY